MVPMLIILLLRIGVIQLNKAHEAEFNTWVSPSLTWVLCTYVAKPFIATFFSKCFGYTN